MLGAAETLAMAGGATRLDRISSGVQVDPDWADVVAVGDGAGPNATSPAAGGDALAADLERHGALEDDERLVVVVVDVERRGRAGRLGDLDDAERPAGPVVRQQDLGEGGEPPAGLALGRQG